jgi:nucleotide-binding universal stress UspA family protein
MIPPYDDLVAASGKMLRQAAAEALGQKPAVEVLESVLPGHPAQALADESAHAALLVVGSPGARCLRRNFAGLGKPVLRATRLLPGGRGARQELSRPAARPR